MALSEHLDLRGSQGCGRGQLLLKDTSLETLHQLGGRRIVNFPHARHHARRARVHEAPHQANQAFASDIFAQSRLART